MLDSMPVCLRRLVGQSWRVFIASLLWGWTMCGPVHHESCACVPVSFRDRVGPHGKLSNCWSLSESLENTAPGSYLDPSPAEEWRS